jgi:hypothetical protein
MKKISLLICLLLLGVVASAQLFSGLWRNGLSEEIFGTKEKYRVELLLFDTGRVVNGYLMVTEQQTGEYYVSGIYFFRYKDSMRIEEKTIIRSSKPGLKPATGRKALYFNKITNYSVMAGSWPLMNAPPIDIEFIRNNGTKVSELLPVLSKAKLINTSIETTADIIPYMTTLESNPFQPPPEVAKVLKRERTVLQTINYTNDSLHLEFFDNGEIDGDTVSVLINNRFVVEKLGLLSRSFHKTVFINAASTDSAELVLYAENLGSIPPNTGVLIITDGAERYELRFRADMQKNAVIVLRKRKL